MIDPKGEYQKRLAVWDAVIAQGERRHLLVSNLRLVTAILAVLLAWLGLGRDVVAPLWWLLPAGAFLVLLVVHALILNARDRANRARAYYERGLSRLDGSWPGSGPDGARFLEGHLYARDLDIFGRGSLFQLIDTARTEAGEDTLADWLRQGAPVDEIRARQAAIAELRELSEFRESLAIYAAEAHVSRTGALTRWALAEPAGLGAPHARLFAALAATTVAVIVAAILTPVTATAVALWLAVQAGIASLWRLQVQRVLRGVDAATDDLSLLSGLLQRIEQQSFSSPKLRGIHRALVVGDVTPSRRIATLQRWVGVRDSVRNELVRPFALALLVRSQAAVAIDRWHARHRTDLGRWLTAIGELEALASLATYAFEHPADPFPELTDGDPVFEGTGLAHPLIPESSAVPNDVRLGRTAAHLLIVSGSNMSGKSTLLRTIGSNALMAMAGAPVRARSLTLTPFAIGTTIKVEDSLQEGYSRFYAEILRIRDIVALTHHHRAVLFLLDEILGGTNSHDRRIGATAIATSLVTAGAIGAMTTHDLALTALVDALGPRAANVHFEDRVEGGQMVFDYRMREGVVEKSNALELMRGVGLDV